MSQYSPVMMQSASVTTPSSRANFLLNDGSHHYRVYCFPDEFLFLQLDGEVPKLRKQVTPWLAVLGGGLPVLLGMMMTPPKQEFVSGGDDSLHYNDNEIVALMKKRRRSFIVDFADVRSATISMPGALGWVSGNGPSVIGTLDIKDRGFFIKSFKFEQPADMMGAIEACQSHLGERAKIEVAWSNEKANFVKV